MSRNRASIFASWKLASIALLTAALSLGWLVPAATSHDDVDQQSHNGSIAFGRRDPVLNNFSLWVARSDGTGQKRITSGPANFSDWSPDGKRIAFDFSDETGVHIATIDPDGKNRRNLTTAVGVQEIPKWSPDGKWITYNAFAFGDDPFTVGIWVMRSDGSNPRQLTDGAIDVEPVFSPDGKTIAFGRIGEDTPDGSMESIHVINTDGTGMREVVPPRPALEHPDWSPDGRSIIFNIGPEHPTAPDSGAVLSVRPSGQGLRVLYEPTEYLRFFKPVWSPDGRKLLVGCNDTRVDLDRLCTISTKGKVTVVVGGDQHVNYPSWGPKPRPGR
ncbi:TolB family protein [Arthrobacter sp. TWP1-1]|uniref:TolB family protein n=1 Tax=Arthrobacter sp. TWP1-1 TaxID=2804568 RepID=UPI003CEF6E4D